MREKQTVDDLLNVDPLDHNNHSSRQHTQKQSDIIQAAQEYPGDTPDELANRVYVSESYVRDVLKRTML